MKAYVVTYVHQDTWADDLIYGVYADKQAALHAVESAIQNSGDPIEEIYHGQEATDWYMYSGGIWHVTECEVEGA